ncbi:hypothetical protein PSHT_15861 [Puccinia striiformis]|uniref:Uncharacterized protein n=1 Tax=Puccinia striiformis TaxID=27350 RepID=A0A2S4UD38_9BASI|nr:hypothetical protein PSHT_15861 [Puccinia striiformis]
MLILAGFSAARCLCRIAWCVAFVTAPDPFKVTSVTSALWDESRSYEARPPPAQHLLSILSSRPRLELNQPQSGSESSHAALLHLLRPESLDSPQRPGPIPTTSSFLGVSLKPTLFKSKRKERQSAAPPIQNPKPTLFTSKRNEGQSAAPTIQKFRRLSPSSHVISIPDSPMDDSPDSTVISTIGHKAHSKSPASLVSNPTSGSPAKQPYPSDLRSTADKFNQHSHGNQSPFPLIDVGKLYIALLKDDHEEFRSAIELMGSVIDGVPERKRYPGASFVMVHRPNALGWFYRVLNTDNNLQLPSNMIVLHKSLIKWIYMVHNRRLNQLNIPGPVQYSRQREMLDWLRAQLYTYLEGAPIVGVRKSLNPDWEEGERLGATKLILIKLFSRKQHDHRVSFSTACELINIFNERYPSDYDGSIFRDKDAIPSEAGWRDDREICGAVWKPTSQFEESNSEPPSHITDFFYISKKLQAWIHINVQNRKRKCLRWLMQLCIQKTSWQEGEQFFEWLQDLFIQPQIDLPTIGKIKLRTPDLAPWEDASYGHTDLFTPMQLNLFEFMSSKMTPLSLKTHATFAFSTWYQLHYSTEFASLVET